MATQLPNPSKTTLYGGLAFLIVFTVISLVYFFMELIDLSQAVTALPQVYYFNKGAFYLPGVVIGLSVLIFAIIYESVLRKLLTKKLASLLTRTGFGAVALMFILPHIVEYAVNRHFENNNYYLCNEASHQWLRSKTIAYTRDKAVCEEISNN